MIDIDDRDIVATRHTADGRFIICSSVDVPPSSFLRWRTAVIDTGGDGFGVPVRLDETALPTGWTARQLLAVARVRMAAEQQRRQASTTAAALAQLDMALVGFREPLGREKPADAVTFAPGGAASPYPWTVARCGEFHLPLCPDPESLGEGVTPEQLLIVLDQLLHDAARAFSYARGLWVCRRHVAAALEAEVRRVVEVRAAAAL